MHNNALSVANYFIDLSRRDEIELRQLGLMKRVYITHGLCLALLGRPALDERFDRVEAWRNGPVIPSVYHSFKHNGNNPIREKSCIIKGIQPGGNIDIVTPELQDDGIKNIAEIVWKIYKNTSDFDLVNLLHKDGSPWAMCYVEGENRVIPDLYTSAYYRKLWKVWMGE